MVHLGPFEGNASSRLQHTWKGPRQQSFLSFGSFLFLTWILYNNPVCCFFYFGLGNGRGLGNPGGSQVWVSLGAGVGHHESTCNLGLPTGMRRPNNRIYYITNFCTVPKATYFWNKKKIYLLLHQPCRLTVVMMLWVLIPHGPGVFQKLRLKWLAL